ncbi:MAG: phytoene/squalene synthase family protein, partial [Saprospiraceae bacterium]|nr:phytoene/squalene synthase family protein [Saprospiraceae bacterium]
LGIYMLNKRLHVPIYSIYGFVRIADEIVDSFHGFKKAQLLEKFSEDTFQAIEDRISTNPVLHAFQLTVNKYAIERELVETFLQSMHMDLDKSNYDAGELDQYILGSAEVVGLMCLRVFVNGDDNLYQQLKHPAMKLGSAFQKVNFLRDLQADFEDLGRSYFPDVDLTKLGEADKARIEEEIQSDFEEALVGIKQLPATARLGVYTAYVYYLQLFRKIRRTCPSRIMTSRIRISNPRKLFLLLKSYLQLNLKLI